MCVFCCIVHKSKQFENKLEVCQDEDCLNKQGDSHGAEGRAAPEEVDVDVEVSRGRLPMIQT